jgi:outer membrane protein insertion porin family
VADGQALLKKNKFAGIDGKEKENVQAFIRQKPNKKVLFLFPIYLNIYNLASKGKSKKWKEKIKNNIGEEPVIYDSTLARFTSKQIQAFFQSKGFFNAEVQHLTTIKRKKAKVTYYVKKNEPYTIKEITYQINDPKIKVINVKSQPDQLYKVGDNYDGGFLSDERNRITKILRDTGYYSFNREFIHYEIDSSLKSRQVRIKMIIENDVDEKPHEIYKINNIYVKVEPNVNYSLGEINPDTLVMDEYFFILKESAVRLKTLRNNLFFKKGEKFKSENVELTYNRLGALGVFRFINLRFNEIIINGKKYLNVYVELISNKKLELRAEGEGTFNSGYLGIAGNVGFTNKNLFGGAEKLDVSLRGGLERQTNPNETIAISPFFNVRENAITANLVIPKFFTPFNLKTFKNVLSPKTRFSFNSGFENRPQYVRQSFNFTYGYEWRKGKSFVFNYDPIQINLVNSAISDTIRAEFLKLGNKLFLESFNPHFSLGSKFAVTFSSQTISKTSNFVFAKLSLESSGFFLNQYFSTISGKTNDQGQYLVFDSLIFYQYVRPDLDLRYYQKLDFKNTFVYRIRTGVGISYGESNFLPFEKQFFTGGSNSLRAFRSRRVGPGAFNQNVDQSSEGGNDFSLDQTGDLVIESNFEYRFDVFQAIKGAIFLDAGNVWVLNENNDLPNSHFEWKDFYKEFALGTGIGARYDFGFFIFRFDVGLKLRDPRFEETNRWVINKFGNQTFKDENNGYKFINYNFGINYPF